MLLLLGLGVGLLVLMLLLLGLGVGLLLALLTSTEKTENEVEGGLLLDVVVRKSTPIFELLPGEDQTLLVRGNTLLVLNLLFDSLDGVRRLHLKGDSLSCQGLDKDLHV